MKKAQRGEARVAKDDGKKGYPVNAIGTTHTARLIGGGATIVAHDELEVARTRRQLRKRKAITRSDAFKGKHD